MEFDEMQTGRGTAPDIASVLDEVASCLTDSQTEKLASFCNIRGLKKVFADAELMRTAECFIENSLNISAAARMLYMHRNTMMYRLDKIRRSTGLDIRKFYDASLFKILYCTFIRGNGGIK